MLKKEILKNNFDIICVKVKTSNGKKIIKKDIYQIVNSDYYLRANIKANLIFTLNSSDCLI